MCQSLDLLSVLLNVMYLTCNGICIDNTCGTMTIHATSMRKALATCFAWDGLFCLCFFDHFIPLSLYNTFFI